MSHMLVWYAFEEVWNKRALYMPNMQNFFIVRVRFIYEWLSINILLVENVSRDYEIRYVLKAIFVHIY